MTFAVPVAEYTAPIVGELSNDGERIVLVATGTDAYGIAAAARRVQLMTPKVDGSEPPGALILPYSWPACVQLAYTFGEMWYPQDRLLGKIRAEIKARTDDLPTELGYDLPEGLHARDYQVAGAHIIARLGNAIITDEPRTGKTITTILGLRQLGLRTPVTPVVAVVPAGTIDQWVAAFELWWPQKTTVAWRGPKRTRYTDHADVYVTSFETATRDAAYAISSGKKSETKLLRLQPRTLIVDELHYIANHESKRSLATRRIGYLTDHFVGLGGTPIKKHVGDFYATLDAMCHDAWPSSETWDDRYLERMSADYGAPTVVGLAPYRRAEFDMTMLGQTRRVARADVLPDLPEQFWTIRTVDLPREWRKAYDDFEADMIAELPIDIDALIAGGLDPEVIEAMSNELATFDVMTQFTHLTQLASSACLVEHTTTVEYDEHGAPFEKPHVHLHPRMPSWKIDELLRILAEREDEQVLIYGPYRKLIELAGEQIEKAGYSVGQIVGGQTPKQRTANQKGFQSGEIQHLVATTGAGGVGLTLTAAGTIVHLQRSLSMVEAKQADDRSSGIGSEKHDAIEVIDIVAHDTVEARVRQILTENAGQLADLLKDPRIVAQMLGGITELPKAKAS